MPRALIKSRLHSSKQKNKFKQEVNSTKSNSTPSLQAYKQNLLSRNSFLLYE